MFSTNTAVTTVTTTVNNTNSTTAPAPTTQLPDIIIKLTHSKSRSQKYYGAARLKMNVTTQGKRFSYAITGGGFSLVAALLSEFIKDDLINLIQLSKEEITFIRHQDIVCVQSACDILKSLGYDYITDQYNGGIVSGFIIKQESKEPTFNPDLSLTKSLRIFSYFNESAYKIIDSVKEQAGGLSLVEIRDLANTPCNTLNNFTLTQDIAQFYFHNKLNFDELAKSIDYNLDGTSPSIIVNDMIRFSASKFIEFIKDEGITITE